MRKYGLFIDGKWMETEEEIKLVNKVDGEVAALFSVAKKEEISQALEGARAALAYPIEPYRRYEILMAAAKLFEREEAQLSHALTQETGKPIREARGEVQRAIQTLILSAEEAKRVKGEMVPLAGAPACGQRVAYTKRVPVGIVCAITPFNFPLNLACHKIGPALAAGNAVLFKPSSLTSLSAVMICKIFEEAGLPRGYLNLLTGPGKDLGALLIADKRIDFYSFTGSAAVGKKLRDKVGLRRISLELGSNAANIVHCDADIDKTAALCTKYAFANAGQVCISCQRVYVHKDVYESFCRAAIAATKLIVSGDPFDEKTDLGPMITEAEAVRAEEWIHEAVQSGAKVLLGGHRQGSYLEPTILTDVQASMKVVSREIFAPVFSVIAYNTIEEAIGAVNDSVYGLQAGVFTGSLEIAHLCAEKLQVGGVIINDSATFRTDNMPYGGVKESGIGHEGPEYAVREMTEERLVVWNFTGVRPF